ncbi:MAG TPA: type II secretion system F family protein, partial [Syntrophales bacterium]|nr:type II secretion system F family protein [Syntrophales bacterium]
MAVFIWEAATKKGEIKKGEMDANDEAAVRGLLRRQGFKSITIKQKPKDLLEYVPFLKQKVKEKNVVVFARIFSTMINAGLPLIQCLDLLAQQEENKAFAKIITSVKEDIEGGSTLQDALKKYPAVFDELFINLVAAGESGGILDVILSRLSNYMEKTMKLKTKVKGSLVYPIIVLVVSIAVITLLLVYVIPVFKKMFEGMGGQLPGPTQFLISVSDTTVHYFPYIVGGVVLFIFLFRRYYRTEKGRLTVDALVLKTPIFGPLLTKVAVAKFTRTLSTMMASGVPILEGLNIVSKTA